MNAYGVFARWGKVLAVGLSVIGGSALADPIKVAALGDSLVQGYGLAPQDGLVPQLQRWLIAQEADVDVISAGVSGDTSAGGLARVAWTLTPDIDAMIVALGGNDVLRATDPAVTQANLAGILQIAADQEVSVLLVGINAPGNYGPEYAAAFDAIWPALKDQYEVPFVSSLFAALPVEDPSELRKVLQADGLHPTPRGVKMIVQEFGPAVLSWLETLD
mgnify:CR=1 FL=1